MTTVFVYEYCWALGLGRDPSDPAHSLYREGRAMWEAVSDDFRALPGMQVVALADMPEAVEPMAFQALVDAADHTLIIAPELDGILSARCEWAGDRALGPTPAAVRLTADKLALAQHWQAHGVPTPATCPSAEVTDRPWRELVLKPRFGAGSTATFHLREPDELVRWVFEPDAAAGETIAQDYVPGRPASVAFLIGPTETVPLLPTFQLLSSDGRFRYEGGELPIRPDLAERAVSLGRRAVACVPGLRGYVGVDLVLGDAADYAIEINPRLTTSYVGLRRLAGFNLAGAMLRAATGSPVGETPWNPGRVRFRPAGEVEYDPTPGSWYG